MANVVNDTREVTSTPEEAEYELRGMVSSYWTGSRLLAGMFTFLAASLAFAYFYLKSSNFGNLWRPKNMTAPTADGAAIFAFTVAGALLVVFAQRRLRAGFVTDYKVAAWTAVLSLVTALGFQCYELTQLPFYPGASGYASTFIGWAVLNFMLLCGCIYWIESLVALSIRLHSALPAGENVANSVSPRAQKFRANVEASSFFLQFVAMVGLVFWILFYLI